MTEVSVIVVGSLHTDIVANGLRRFPNPGELLRGAELVIGPGGKSRNIAQMAAALSPEGAVAMISRTAEDHYGLWRPPVDALKAAEVNIDFVQVIPRSQAVDLPAIAIIPVTEAGQNQIIVLPGVSNHFSTEDIDAAEQLFVEAEDNKGVLIITLEGPLATIEHAVAKAERANIKVIFDPGGIEQGMDLSNIILASYFIKPNEYEAEVLTGVRITDFESATAAAGKLKDIGAQNILITHGEDGGYLFTDNEKMHIPIRDLSGGSTRDATGCGDQTTATICALLQQGKPLREAVEAGLLSATMQFYRPGIQPVTKSELEAQL